MTGKFQGGRQLRVFYRASNVARTLLLEESKVRLAQPLHVSLLRGFSLQEGYWCALHQELQRGL